jgi:putative aldouronate transport system substrate-binding protein
MEKACNNLLYCIAVSGFILGLFSCNTNDKENIFASSKAKVSGGTEPTVINMYIFATEESYQNGNIVLEEFKKRTGETLNIDLRIHTMSVQDYRERMVLIASSGTEADIVFDAPWMNMTLMIQRNIYKELSGYFDGPNLSGLREAFPSSFLNSNRFYGGVYGIPIMDAPLDIPGVYYRKDLADKYGIVIESYNALRNFFEMVHHRENGMSPMSIQNNRGFYFMFDSPLDMAAKEIYTMEGITGGVRELFYVGISPANRITGVSALGDPESSYSSYQSPYNTFEGFNRYFLEAAVWGAYVPEDSVMRETADPLFVNGFSAATEGTIREFGRRQSSLKIRLPQAELGFWPYIKVIRDREKGVIPLSFRAWNYLCIPGNSVKTEKVFEFLNWIFESQENNDLFAYGIRGLHWDKADYSPPVSDEEYYQFPGYELTWNPRFVRIPPELPDDVKSLLEYQYASDSFKSMPISGFVFDERSVINELAKIRVIYEKYRNALLCGAYDDPATVLHDMNRQMEVVGMAKVKGEIARQVQAYLDAGRGTAEN